QLISDIIASGNNYGMMIMQQNETTPYQSLIFGSSNNTDTNIHPALQICYVIDSTTNDSSKCITLRPSAAAGQDIDARISTQVPTANFSTDPDFFSATWTCGSAGNCIDRSLIMFDLSSIPASATITNATLSLYADNASGVGMSGSPMYGSNDAGWLLRVTSPWAINTVTWNTQPTTTTNDEVIIPQSTSGTENYSLNVSQLISDIIASGNNYGMMIMQQNETTPYQSLIFGSSNNTDTNIHPQLQICYNVLTGVNSLKAINHIQVYPNPAHDKLVFKVDYALGSELQNCFVELYNSIGEKVKSVELSPYQTTINTDNFARGLYLYRIMSHSSLIQTGKIELQ
ncbi:MAG TPA: DNRLRE domain-containing protein, partial [Bacteroidia bacterium]|nr:DNRLRE domain-containing protein [Bacteroidia bacterium]